MTIRDPTVRAAKGARPRPVIARKTIVTAILTGFGCLGSLALAFFGLSGMAYAAWMTALPPQSATMSHDAAVRQARIGIAMVVVGCVAGVALVAWSFYLTVRRRSR